MEAGNQNLNQHRNLATRLGLSKNVFWMSVVSFLNDLSSDMIFPFIPIFLTSVLGASLTFVGLVEGIADATASLLKIPSGWISDRMKRRKPFAVLGYSLSAISKPLLALASLPWHVLGVRFLDRVGKGTRESPRDALISFSTPRSLLGRAFGFHRAMDTLGAALGPLIAVLILPFINENYRILFFLSFVASFFAVLILIVFVREVRLDGSDAEIPETAKPLIQDMRPPPEVIPRIAVSQGWRNLGAPFFLFLAVATIASLGKASEAFLILRAREIGLTIVLVPIAYFAYSITAALLGTPLGIVADRVGKRNTFVAGLIVFTISYIGFSLTSSLRAFWLLLILYGLYSALTDGVGRAVVAGLVRPEVRATAFGIYNATTGLALLPASFVFGYFSQQFGSRVAFLYGAGLSLVAVFLFFILRKAFQVQS
jgi:MFS family permease